MVRRRLAQGSTGDDGNAVVLVLGAMMVLAALALTSLGYAVSSQKYARHSQDWSAALAAAQAGIDDYIARLNRNDSYYATTDCTNVALQSVATCSTANGWATVDPAHTATTDARYHYSIDASSAQSAGTIAVTSTGRVNGVYRTVQAALRKDGSSNYLYYTDFESADPANTVAYPSGAAAACGGNGYQTAQHWWQGRSLQNCAEITFLGGDTLDGPVLTNDTIAAAANSSGTTPLFKQQVSTANPSCTGLTASGTDAAWSAACLRSGSTARFNSIMPRNVPLTSLADNTSSFSGYPGCHYFGAVRIVFSATGTMTVWNKKVNNLSTAPVAIASASGTTPACGALADLDSTNGATVPVPNGMVIYAAAASGSTSTCSTGQLGGPGGRTLPLAGDSSMTGKYCTSGDVYVEGTVQGRVTVAAAGTVVVTGDLLLAGGVAASSTDLLGLVSAGSVEVFHPIVSGAEVSGWPTSYDGIANTVTIQASIQALWHSFTVQLYSTGSPKGTLSVVGSIAQRWRGAVATSSSNVLATGYLKSYSYDPRLKLASPPYFPSWVSSQWRSSWFSEITTAASVKS